MANENGQSVHEPPESLPPTGSLSLKRWRRTDDVEGLRRRVYRALRIAEEIAYAEDTPRSERLKACTVMQQTARTYLKVLEADELLERIEALEEAMEQPRNQRNGRYR